MNDTSLDSRIPKDLAAIRQSIRDHGLWPEDGAVTRLLRSLELTGGARHRAVAVAKDMVEGARARRDERSYLDAFLQEFGLSNQEGIALHVPGRGAAAHPDDATADRLIAEKLGAATGPRTPARSESLFVNASTWGLMLTGRIWISTRRSNSRMPRRWLRRRSRARLGEPVVRPAVRRAMRIIGGEFVVGRTIEEALDAKRGARRPSRSARSTCWAKARAAPPDADRYLASYEHAIDAIGARGPAGALPHERLVDLDQAVGAGSALCAAGSASACSSACCRGSCELARNAPRQPAFQSRSMRRRRIAWIFRSM